MNNVEQKNFFRECLYTALMSLLDKKPLERIGIGELCSRAGVSRMTYYRNYKSKEDILAQHLGECYDSFLNYLREQEELSVDKICLFYFTFLKTEQDFFIKLMKSRLASIFVDKLAEYLENVMELFLPQIKLPYYIKSYISGGFSKMSIDWILNGMDAPVEEMATLLSRFTVYMNAHGATGVGV